MKLIQLTNPDKPLPRLRPDIEIFAGPLEKDGSPTFVIHDPVAGVFSKIGWATAEVLQRLRSGQTTGSLIKELQKQTTIRTNPEEVNALCEDAYNQGLTLDSTVKPPEKLYEAAMQKKQNIATWLLFHYLYFRIPLLWPDRFLTAALPWARWFTSKGAKALYLLCAFMGLYFLVQRFETYVSTFLHFFSFKGAVAYFFTIVLVKAAHEFGHAFTAKHFGVRVPAMGVAFMVFMPVAFSDVTDAWRLRNRRKRLAIALAGIKVELVVGVIALALWGLTPPGIVNSICFLLSSTTLISTVLVNMNPAMRFDGYYILSDLWGIDNLTSQTTLFTKWFIRRHLFGINLPCPMQKPPPRRQVQILAYSFFAWTYRFFLYLGIAMIVYYKFTKTVGMILFITEIGVFIVRPVVMEVKMLVKMKNMIKVNLKLGILLGAVLVFLFWAGIPLPRTRTAPALYVSQQVQTLYAPGGGQVKDVFAKRGDRVGPGDVILQMESRALNAKIDYLKVAVQKHQQAIEAFSTRGAMVAMVPEKANQLAAAREELAGSIEQRRRYAIKAGMAGTLVDLDEILASGAYVKQDQPLGVIAADSTRIDAFVSEKEVEHLTIGRRAVFYPSDQQPPISGIIERIDPIREETVDFLDIGAVAAKTLPLVPDKASDQLTLLESYFRVSIAVINPHAEEVRLGQSGYIRYKTSARSLAWELMMYCYSVLVRESSF